MKIIEKIKIVLSNKSLLDNYKNKILFQSINFRLIFLFLSLCFMFFMPYLSKDAGLSGDEEKHHLQAIKVYNYYKTFGKDTSAIYNINSIDPMQYNGQSFDNITYLVEKIFHIDNIYEMRHFINALIGWLIILFSGLIAKELIGWGGGVVVMFFLFITPFFLGHSFNNNKDIPITLGFILSLYYIIKYFRQIPYIKIKTIFLLCGSIALAISIRIAGLLVVLYLCLYTILFIFNNNLFKNINSSYIWKLFIQLFGIIIIAYIIGIITWPFLLIHPIDNLFVIIKSMNKFPILLSQIFDGRIIWSDQIPWYYLLKYILISVPIVILAGFAFFLILIYKIVNKKNWLEIFLIFLSCIFPVLYSTLYNNSDYGGLRHYLFMFPSMVICAVIGYFEIFKLLKNRLIITLILSIFIIYFSIKPILHIIRNHPLEYVYYNEFVGGVNGAYTNYEMDYFLNSPHIASTWLLKYLKENKISKDSKIVIASNGSLGYYFRHDTSYIQTIYCNYNNRCSQDWDYLIFCNLYIDPYSLRNKYYPFANTIFQVKVDTVPVCVIVKRKQKFDLLAYKYTQSKDFTNALENYKIALDIEPKSIDILVNYISCYISDSNYVEAQNLINYTLTLYPNNPDALYDMGIIYMCKNKINAAINQFQYIINNVNSEVAQVDYNLGICYLIKKDYDNALISFKNCISLDRKNKNAYYNIAQVLKMQNKFDESDEYMKKAY
jgi:tetratricopeptide (TPR) repeat protein